MVKGGIELPDRKQAIAHHREAGGGIAAVFPIHYPRALLRAFDLPVSWEVAVLLLVALQIGGKVLPAAPLGGIGIFQIICMEVLGLFGVEEELAFSYGVVLHFAVFVPGLVLGALALYRTHGSLKEFREEAERGVESI
jgi:uncharacterized membrane protein YbhN (UPF0104 family)